MQTQSSVSSSTDVQLITKVECASIIRETLQLDRFNVVDYVIERICDDMRGFLGEHLRLKIIVEENNQTKEFFYFLKTLPISNPKQKAIIEEYGIFKKEALTYSLILVHLGGQKGESKWRPSCFLSRPDLIILEELSHDGYQHLPYRFHVENLHIQTVLRSLAAMHAASLRYEKETGTNIGEKFEDILQDISCRSDNSWFRAGLKAIKAVALAKTKYSNDRHTCTLIQENLMSEMEKVFNLMDDIPPQFLRVLVHRDLWLNNTMFKFASNFPQGKPDFSKPLNCVLVDFQICRYQPPAIDFLMATFMLMRRLEREKYFEVNQKFYFEQLRMEVKKAEIILEERMTFETFKESCDYYKLFALIIRAVFYQTTHLPEGTVGKLYKKQDDYHHFVIVDRSEAVKEFMEKDEYYHDWMVEAVEEIVEFTLLNN